MWQQFNVSPKYQHVGDCVIRAISFALNQEWDKTYIGIAAKGLAMKDMPSSNNVWAAYLKEKGWVREALPDTCPECYTISDFASDHNQGVFIVAAQSHVVAVRDGDYFDTWDSGEGITKHLEAALHEAQDEETRQAIQRFMEEMK